MMKRNRLIAVGGLFLLLFGCSNNENERNESSPPKEVSVQASSLLDPDQTELKLHLNWTGSGAVTFAEPSSVVMSYELWQNGTAIDPGGTFPSVDPAESVSFALRPSAKELGKQTFSISFPDSAVMTTELPGLPTEPEPVAHGAVQLLGIDEAIIQPGEKKAVWGYAATEIGKTSPGSEDELKQSPWALIVYVEAVQ
ncbi:hypothetical protein [Domibacillus enclensis]|uniref:Spondin domain-containing protein n=1 Tax=Domibacillus enclensis TaxID=1017273 RepID=A0A1N6Y0H9_9BACI|nr:hypothetical protein [Domibacillus enclensis]OXS77474.1 hypothetical protein B1B05_11600 [Domibacillus enclensis]SIR08036.1 hypothetical protein SAMN05443094_105109 [Domibacillus enclensis]